MSLIWWAQRGQVYRIQADGGSVHVWVAFHSDVKSPIVLPDRCLTSELYRIIFQNTLVPLARQHFRDNCRYQNYNATPRRARVVLDFIQQGNVTKMEQPARSPNCISIEHICDELIDAITSMDNPPLKLGELRQVLLDKWADFPLERLQRLLASIPRSLAAIIASRGVNARYWPGIHKTTPTGCIMHKI